jgi:tRNA pseudouridine38-40 synthase
MLYRRPGHAFFSFDTHIMARFKLYLEYEGTRFSGWQIQKNARTVQGEIHNALVEMFKNADFELYGSGRTDAGVHALYQVAHLEAETMLGPEIIRMKLNDALPADINIIEVEKAHKNFHARHDAVARSYMYQISRRRTAFGKRFVWWIKDQLNFAQMARAAALFEGMKNFQSFTADDEEEKSMKVLVEGIEIKEAGDLILIRIVGSHFLWKMVRQIVGVLAEVGRGKMAVKDIERMLEEKSNAAAPLTAPPSGLFLERVYYTGDARLTELVPMMTIEQPHAFHSPEVKQHHSTTGGHADKHIHGEPAGKRKHDFRVKPAGTDAGAGFHPGKKKDRRRTPPPGFKRRP